MATEDPRRRNDWERATTPSGAALRYAGRVAAQRRRDERLATLDTRQPNQFARLAAWERSMGDYE